MKKIAVLLMLAFFVAGCAGDSKGVISMSSPFIGGTQGLVVSFQDFRSEVFSGGSDPFDVSVRLENMGESFVPANNVQVKLSGINPVEFGRNQLDLIKNAPDDIIEMRKVETGILSSPPIFVDFANLNRAAPVSGASAQYTIRADVCYLYSTLAGSKLCIRDNLLTPRAGGICEINEAKTVFNSGAPVQISGFSESARAKDKIGFTFDIRNVGSGYVFQRNTFCDKVERKNENRVYVIVESGLSGLSCTGLESADSTAEGFVTLYGGSKTISCTQTVLSRSDYEQIVTIEVIYDYEQSVQNSLLVKSAGE